MSNDFQYSVINILSFHYAKNTDYNSSIRFKFSVLAFKLIFDYSNPGKSSLKFRSQLKNHFFVNFLKCDICKKDQWNKDHPQCAGYLQSPVVIAASRSVAVPLPALELVGYHDFLPPPLILKNNGHTG